MRCRGIGLYVVFLLDAAALVTYFKEISVLDSVNKLLSLCYVYDLL